MTTLHRRLTLALLVLGAVGLPACNRGGPSNGAGKKTYTVGFSQIGAESGWRVAETQSIRSEADKRGVKLQFSDAQQKQENQIQALRGFVDQGVDAIILAPVVETGWEPVLKEIKRAKIPVILVDRGVKVGDDSLYATLIASDFVAEGRMAAEWLAKKTGGKAKIAELKGTPGAAPAIDREKGFREVIDRHPDMQIIVSQTGDFTRAKGLEVMEAFLSSRGKEITAVYAHNDDMALGAIQAIEAAGKKPGQDVLVVSIDGVKAAFEAMVEGKLNCSVECNPLLGPAAFDAVEKILAGQAVPKRTVVPDRVFDQSAAREAISGGQYQRGAGDSAPRYSLTTDPSTPDAPLLVIRGLCKTFPGVKALADVDFTLRRGEIHTLMGENGAGKSTLIKVLTGVYRRDGGRILLDGQDIDAHSPGQAQALGISAVYQEVNLIPYLSVAENIFLGRQPTRWGRIDWRQINRRAREALARLELDVDVTGPLNSYSVAVQQMVAIARALDVSARVLVLDEPTSSLDAHEVEHLFAMMRRLKNQGLGIVFISHFLDEVYEISDRFTVLRNGRLVGEYEAAQLPRLELISKMIGKPVAEVAAREARSAPPAEGGRRPLLAARGLGKKNSIAPFDLDVYAGEVVGLAGLLGSGRTEVARLLFGIDRADGGTVEVEGRPVKMTSPRRAVAAGLGFLPEDRKVQGIVPDLSVRENIVLALQASKGWLRRLPWREQDRLARHYIKALNVATSDAEKPIKLLSGGNQQKAILARWLASHPKLLILDEPTRGIDVGAKAEIETLIASLCREGMAIVFISSELDEVVRDSQRVAVLRDRRKVAELSGAEIDRDRILQIIAG